jgi:hypothetical protein
MSTGTSDIATPICKAKPVQLRTDKRADKCKPLGNYTFFGLISQQITYLPQMTFFYCDLPAKEAKINKKAKSLCER